MLKVLVVVLGFRFVIDQTRVGALPDGSSTRTNEIWEEDKIDEYPKGKHQRKVFTQCEIGNVFQGRVREKRGGCNSMLTVDF